MGSYFKRLVKISAICLVAVAVVIITSLPAFGHVSINPDEAPKGGYGAFAFRVPNESDSASTIKIEVKFPEEHPIASVRTTAQDGWNATVEKSKPTKELKVHGSVVDEVVTKITWTGGEIKPGEFAEFNVSMGPLPTETDELIFKTLQTYSDGEVVGWIEEPIEGGAEPEHPAQVLSLEDEQQGHGATTKDDSESREFELESDSVSPVLVFVSIGIGVVALLVGVVALTKKK